MNQPHEPTALPPPALGALQRCCPVLVLMVRETPLHLGHLRLMTQVTETGAVILPPMPAFYHRPQTLDDIINQSVNKALDQFDVDVTLFKRWTGNEERELAHARR